ncbi:MAG: choice-of-anchor D domain-containing protein [Deltaproteobacteria bacterium]
MRPITLALALLLSLSLTAATGCCRRSTPQLQSKDATPLASPNPLDFGNVPVGGSKVLPLVLENTGSLELDIASVAFEQGQAGTPEFVFTDQTNLHAPFGAALLPGASAKVYLEFQPTQRGEQTATLAIKSNSAGSPVYDVPLKGNATSVSITVQPTSIDFGNVQLGTQSSLTVTFTNQGTDPSDPIQVQPPIGTQASNFGWTGTPGVLAPGQSFALQMTFTPAVQGPAAALVPYLDCATCNPSQVSLKGVGVDGQIVFSPDPVSFVNVPSGSTSSLPVTLTNQGLASVSLQSLATGRSNGPFALTGGPTLPLTLGPQGTTRVTVDYTASAGGNDQDALIAISQPLDGKGNPAPVAAETASDPLSGNGTLSPCSLQLKPPSLNFGNPPVGTAVVKSVTVSNVGQQACSVAGIALGTGTDPAFALGASQPTQVTLAPGASATIAVSCDLTSTGTPLLHRGALVFTSNDPARASGSIPLSAYVKGTGPYADGWPKWHADNTDQGQSQADTSANQGTVLWKFNVGVPQSAGGLLGSINPNPTYMNSPVVGPDGTAYQLGMDGTFYAVDPGGNLLWKTKLLSPNPDEHPATPILAADNTLYVETGCDGAGFTPAQLFHLDAATGAILFQVGPPTGAGSGGNSSNGNNSADGFDVNPSIGQDGLLFDGDDFGQTVTYTTGPGGSVSQGSEVILPWSGERVAVALDAQDNSYWCSSNLCFGVSSPAAGFAQIPAWPSAGTSIGGSGFGFANSDLAYDQNHTGWLMVAVGTQTGSTGETTLAAVDPANGSIHWSLNLPSGPTPGSFSPFTASGIFSSDVGNSAPAVATDGTVYVGNVDGLYAVDGATGTVKAGFPFKTSSDVDSAAAIGGDGTVFFGTADGTFYAVRPDGSLRFKVMAQGRISSSPAIGPDGTVFFVSDDGNLTAVR